MTTNGELTPVNRGAAPCEESSWALAREFERTFSRQPHVCWSAPGRVNVIGEYMDQNESFVLPIAIQRATRAVAAAAATAPSSCAR